MQNLFDTSYHFNYLHIPYEEPASMPPNSNEPAMDYVEQCLRSFWKDAPAFDPIGVGPSAIVFYTDQEEQTLDPNYQNCLIENVMADLQIRQSQANRSMQDLVFDYLDEESLSPSEEEAVLEYLKEFTALFDCEATDQSTDLHVGSLEFVDISDDLPTDSLSSPLEDDLKEAATILSDLAKKVEAKHKKTSKSVQDFELVPLEKDRFFKVNSRLNVEDRTGIGKDFKKEAKQPAHIGLHHMWKRINFFLVMSRVVVDKAPFLQDYKIPYNRQDQYAATATLVPPNYDSKKHFANWDKTHISLLPKLVLEHKETKKLFRMTGPLEVNNIMTKIELFLNICDIAPKTVNAIDWFGEYDARTLGCKLLEKLRANELTIEQALIDFVERYDACLEDLSICIEKQDYQLPKNCPASLLEGFQSSMTLLLEDSHSLAYLKGMRSALKQFTEQLKGCKTNSDPSLSLYI